MNNHTFDARAAQTFVTFGPGTKHDLARTAEGMAIDGRIYPPVP